MKIIFTSFEMWGNKKILDRNTK